MSTQLPNRPNLEHLRSQAKALLTNLRTGNADALASLKEFLPTTAEPTLTDAQTAIARQYGFASWPKLQRHVEALRSLDGTWSFTAMEIEGAAMPVHNLGGANIQIDGDRFWVNSMEAQYAGVYSIDVEAVPHTIDMRFEEGPEAGRTSLGIFEQDGDVWRICLGLTGVERPTAFVSTPGSHHVLETLARGAVAIEAAQPAPEEPEVVDTEGWDVMTPELAKLQGEWVPISINLGGMELPSEHIAEGVRTCVGNETTLKFGPQTWMQAKTRTNGNQFPIHIDYLNLAGPGKGRVQRGIMKWDGEAFAICVGKPAGPRPTGFEVPEGSGFTLSRWKPKA